MGVFTAPRRRHPLYIAVPASTLTVEPSLQLKTIKAGFIARAAAVFRVDTICLYVDRAESWRDLNVFKKLLEYAVTPPYLRKRVYPPGLPELRYASVLKPLQIPTHGVEGPSEGEVREAYVLRRVRRNVYLVDAGLGREVELEVPAGIALKRGDRVLVKIASIDPPRVEYIEKPDVYTGYRVETFDNFSSMLRSYRNRAYIIATSRRGRDVREARDEIVRGVEEKGSALVLFGSPSEGLFEIAEREGVDLEQAVDVVVNTIPAQGTLTVRTEEAIWATLAVLNLWLG